MEQSSTRELRKLIASHVGTQGMFFYRASILAREGKIAGAYAYACYNTYAKFITGEMRDYHV